jgi:hypothetical protein
MADVVEKLTTGEPLSVDQLIEYLPALKEIPRAQLDNWPKRKVVAECHLSHLSRTAGGSECVDERISKRHVTRTTLSRRKLQIPNPRLQANPKLQAQPITLTAFWSLGFGA